MKLLATQSQRAAFAQLPPVKERGGLRFQGAPYYIGKVEPNVRTSWAIWKGTCPEDEVILDPAPSLLIRDHSPDGFSWGYGGSGPAQAALGILLDCLGDGHEALDFYQDFKWKHLARLDMNQGWIMTRAFIEEWAATPERVQ